MSRTLERRLETLESQSSVKDGSIAVVIIQDGKTRDEAFVRADVDPDIRQVIVVSFG